MASPPGGHARPRRALGNRQRAQQAVIDSAQHQEAPEVSTDPSTAVNPANASAGTDPYLAQVQQAPPVDVTARFEAATAQAAATLASPPLPAAPPVSATGPQPAQAAPSAPAKPSSAMGWLHRDLSAAGNALSHAWPVVRALASNPVLDDLVEAALRADGLGVEVTTFQTVIDALTAASDRKEAAQKAGAGIAGQADAVAAGTDATAPPVSQ